MLSKILSITGRPGLYKLLSTNQNMSIAESLKDGKKIPVYLKDKVISLNDVAIYTNDGGDTPLRVVFQNIKKKYNGEKVQLDNPSKEQLFNFIDSVLPTFDKDRVYSSDIKKIIAWYNELIEHNINLEEEKDGQSSGKENTN